MPMIHGVKLAIAVLCCLGLACSSLGQVSRAEDRPTRKSESARALTIPEPEALTPSKEWRKPLEQGSPPSQRDPARVGRSSVAIKPVSDSDLMALAQVEDRPNLVAPVLFGLAALGIGLGSMFALRRWADRQITPGRRFQ
ncbi:MAG: hypothetical protein MUC92_00095 [Fimbriimonadaceae bacterium]|jgi:hypothetical protein|nr:hypothetical protein [Fimbriimonadaceae bacterium]